MHADWIQRAEAICGSCGGHCCKGACPPLSRERIEIILSHGEYGDRIEKSGYWRIRTKEYGNCSMLKGGRCEIHAFKPETCVAGPFTFAVTEHTIEIFLKRASVCPLIPHLKADREMYDMQYRRAIDHITRLVARFSDKELRIISAIPEDETDLVAILHRPEGRLP